MVYSFSLTLTLSGLVE